jgi:predicted nucleotidyltransferase
MKKKHHRYVFAWKRRFARKDAESRALAAQVRAELTGAVALLRKYGAKRIFLFGSLCRPGRFKPGSDIDLAVEGIPPKEFIRAAADLMMTFDWPIDLKPFEELDDFFRCVILEKGEIIYVEER